MPDCKCLSGCPFFHDKMPIDKGIGAIYKQKYCQGENASCARYMVFMAKGKGNVPPNLYPNMTDRANKIIAGA